MKKIALYFVALLSFAVSATSQNTEDKISFSPALLIIDVQKEFLPMMSKQDQDVAIQMMNYSLMIFRQLDLPIIRVYHKSAVYGVVPGKPGFEFSDSLQIKPEDLMVVKTYPSAFTKTELDSLLKAGKINTLFLCGLSSTGCVLATYMDAFSYDYKAFMIKDAMLSQKTEYTDQIESIFSALDLDTVMYMLQIGSSK